MPKPSDYKHIRAWGIMMASFPYYVHDQQEKAAQDNAPLDAVFEKDGIWHTYSQVTAMETIHRIDGILKRMEG